MPGIELEGVRVHNLKNVSLMLPLNRLIVVTGVSGSGKSSLAFDTLYAEGQRRYIESFSPYARQFLNRIERPDADRIDHIPPAIALMQGTIEHGPRSTIGTVTEIDDYLRLLYVGLGRIICPACAEPVTHTSADDVLRFVLRFGDRTRYMVCFPTVFDSEFSPADLLTAGFHRVISDGRTCDVSSIDSASEECSVVVDRLVAGRTDEARILDSLETAFHEGDGQCLVLSHQDEAAGSTTLVDERTWRIDRFHSQLVCGGCDRVFETPTPRLFNANSSAGACPECEGVGSVDPGNSGGFACPACHGARLQPNALAVQLGGRDFTQSSALSVGEAASFLQALRQESVAVRSSSRPEILFDELEGRLTCLRDVGLDYLTLDRRMQTLSAGEAQRVALTATLGTNLVSALYVLDEPSVGLHPRDSRRVIGVIRRLQQAGNTVVVVEHEEAFVAAADEVVDIGPGAGADGGELVFQGTPAELAAAGVSVTGEYLAGRVETSAVREKSVSAAATEFLRLTGARRNNLRSVDVEIQLGRMTVVAGVSGSGKSSLVEQTLYPALCRALGQTCAIGSQGEFDELLGTEHIDDVVLVDQSPIGRTRRSNAATYMKMFDEIRKTFAATPDARVRSFGSRHFSFNSKEGGRCPKCEGTGSITIDMQFLADLSVTCAECHGSRFQREVLEVRYRGRNIAEVLGMTVSEAFPFFRAQRGVQKKLKFLKDVGLDYLPLGQPAPTLSGGESQRLKLATFLAAGAKSRTLFLLDEPTKGLHRADIAQLLECLDALLNGGGTIVIVEHSLDIIRHADHVVELGPEAGDGGGRVVATGTPAEIAACEESVTGEYLRERKAESGKPV